MAEIRFIKKSEWDKLRAFNEAEYRPGHILTNKVYYDWQFDNFVNSKKDSYTTLGLFDDKEDLLGTFGLFATPYNFYGQTITGTSLCNLMVKKSLRNLGYGYLLLERAAALNDFSIDHTINEAAWPMFMRSGWQGADLKRYLYVINPKTPLYELSASTKSPPADSLFRFEQVFSFDQSVNVFWQDVKNRYPISIERSAEYLNWRYAQNPLIQYRMFTARNAERLGAVAILRIEEPRTEESLGMEVGRLIDFFASEETEFFALTALVQYYREIGIDFIDYFTNGDFHKKSLGEAGFVYGDEGSYEQVPILFNPVSTKRKKLNFAVKAQEPFSLKDCYTTKGGGDQDRAY